jgi:hypothetical protein
MLNMYLRFTIAVNAFRTLMYIFNQEHVCKVKVTKKAWEDKGIQEVMYAYTSMIRTFMAFRTVVAAWVTLMIPDGETKFAFCAILTALDIYLMSWLILRSHVQSGSRVLQHHDIRVPGALQASLCVAGLICLGLVLRNR